MCQRDDQVELSSLVSSRPRETRRAGSWSLCTRSLCRVLARPRWPAYDPAHGRWRTGCAFCPVPECRCNQVAASSSQSPAASLRRRGHEGNVGGALKSKCASDLPAGKLCLVPETPWTAGGMSRLAISYSAKTATKTGSGPAFVIGGAVGNSAQSCGSWAAPARFSCWAACGCQSRGAHAACPRRASKLSTTGWATATFPGMLGLCTSSNTRAVGSAPWPAFRGLLPQMRQCRLTGLFKVR